MFMKSIIFNFLIILNWKHEIFIDIEAYTTIGKDFWRFSLKKINNYIFHIDDTFEMRTSGWFKICISIDKLRMLARVFISNGKKGGNSKIAERLRERERVCVRASADNSNSVGWRNTSVAISNSRHLCSIIKDAEK